MKKCYYKSIASSDSPEGKQYQSQYPEIDFYYCNHFCTGYLGYGTCEKFRDAGLEKKVEGEEK